MIVIEDRLPIYSKKDSAYRDTIDSLPINSEQKQFVKNILNCFYIELENFVGEYEYDIYNNEQKRKTNISGTGYKGVKWGICLNDTETHKYTRDYNFNALVEVVKQKYPQYVADSQSDMSYYDIYNKNSLLVKAVGRYNTFVLKDENDNINTVVNFSYKYISNTLIYYVTIIYATEEKEILPVIFEYPKYVKYDEKNDVYTLKNSNCICSYYRTEQDFNGSDNNDEALYIKGYTKPSTKKLDAAFTELVKSFDESTTIYGCSSILSSVKGVNVGTYWTER